MGGLRNTLAIGAAMAVLGSATSAGSSSVYWGLWGNSWAHQQRAAAEFEARCQRLSKLDYMQLPVTPTIRLVVARYFTLAAAGDRKGLAKLFVRRDGGWWRSPTGEQDVRNLVDPFIPVGTPGDQMPLELVSFVVAHDFDSARGVWKLTVPDPAAPGATREVHYAIDIVGNPAPRKWNLYRVNVYPGPLMPVTPRPYCHLQEADEFDYGDIPDKPRSKVSEEVLSIPRAN